MKSRIFLLAATVATLTLLSAASANAASIEMNFLDASGAMKPAGVIQYEDTKYGLLFTPQLTGLPAGLHGFHIHAKPNCGLADMDGKPVPGAAAGGHWDPENTSQHMGPYSDLGHKGDLPAIYVNAEGVANYPVLAPRLKAADVAGHSLMIHAGGDNHSDHPMKLGGGGARLLCGVF